MCDFACYRSVSVKDPLTVARRVADGILTLPIYDSLKLDDVDRVCSIIIEAGACRDDAQATDRRLG